MKNWQVIFFILIDYILLTVEIASILIKSQIFKNTLARICNFGFFLLERSYITLEKEYIM